MLLLSRIICRPEWKLILPSLVVTIILSGCGEISSGDESDDSSRDEGNSSVPTLSLSAQPGNLVSNESTTLDWDSSGAVSCEASGDWSGNRALTGSELIANLLSNKSYTLTCVGPGGTATRTVNVVIVPPSAPVVNITASPLVVVSGGSTRLSWNSSNVDTCTASGNWSGGKNTSGTRTRNNLTSDKTYTLTCTGPGGTASDSVDVVVVPPPPGPTLNFSGTPTVVSGNGTTTLSWTTTNVDNCSASGDWSGNKSASGAQVINSITSNRQFDLTCTGPGGTVNDRVSVTYSSGNLIPVANAGPDQTVTTGSQVSLDGSASSDADGDPLQFSWTLTSKPGGSTASLNDAGTASPTFIADVDGNYQISLVVNDGTGDSPADTVAITSLDSSASIYYVATNGSNSNDGSANNEWKTISYGISRLQAGDTLIVRNGNYSGKNNFITDIPSGSAGNFTTVMAESPYGVRIVSSGSLNYNDVIMEASGQYIHVDGFIFDHKNSLDPPYTGEMYGQYLKLTRSIFRREGAQDDYGGWLTVGGSYLLIEDVAGVGAARYGFQVGGTNSSDRYIIFRRVVGRLDYQDTPQPKSTFVHYGNNNSAQSHHIVYQNCIALDSNQPSYDGGGFGTKNGGIKVIKTAKDDIISGSIILNERVEYQAVFLEGKNNLLEDSVIWGNRLGNYGSVPPVAFNISSGFLSPPHNSAAINITAGQNQNSSEDNTTASSQDYLLLPNDYPQNAGNKAVILKRIGEAGTFYGEPGWDTVTNEDLWPWPYEDEIKSVFAQPNPTPSGYTPQGNNAARGFAAYGNGLYGGAITLTSYIWEYLGNPCPNNYCFKSPVP